VHGDGDAVEDVHLRVSGDEIADFEYRGGAHVGVPASGSSA
jgi:hypothetical protein